MFCPQCGTKAKAGGSRFCHECGAELAATTEQRDAGAAPGTSGPAWQGYRTSAGTPFQHPLLTTTHVIVKDNTVKTVLIVAGLLLLLPLAIPIVFGTLLAGLFAGVAVIGAAIKLAPVIAIALVVYWLLNRQRHATHASR